jgi:hypothetical protein
MVSIIISNWRRLSSGSQQRDRKSAFPAASAEIPFPGGSHGLMKEALRNIEEQFKDVKSIGPVSVATFMGITDKDEYDRITRDDCELLRNGTSFPECFITTARHSCLQDAGRAI